MSQSCQALGGGYVYGGILVTGIHALQVTLNGRALPPVTAASSGGALPFAPGTVVRCTATVDGAQVDLGTATAR